MKLILYLTCIVVFQVLVGLPFLLHNAHSYLTCSFNFSRQFFYIWSVNWQVCYQHILDFTRTYFYLIYYCFISKMVPEDIFLSGPFSNALLAIHLITLVYFGFAWCYKTGGVFSTIFGKQILTFLGPTDLPIRF